MLVTNIITGDNIGPATEAYNIYSTGKYHHWWLYRVAYIVTSDYISNEHSTYARY